MLIYTNEQLISAERQYNIEPWLRVLVPALHRQYGEHNIFPWEPISIKQEIFPFDNDLDVELLLDACLYSGLVGRETIDGKDVGVLLLSKKNISRIPAITDIFNHWQKILGHPKARLDQKRKKTIENALKMGYETSQLKDAISGCAQTPFNMGHNDRGEVYDGIHLIFRDAEQIDRFIKNFNNPPIKNKQMKRFDELAEWAINAQQRYQ